MTARRAAGWFFGVVGALIVLILIAVAVVLRSETVGRRLVRFALDRATVDIEIGSVRGPLGGPLVLGGVRYRSPAASVRIDSILVDWRPTGLLGGRVHLRSLLVEGVHVELPDSAPPDPDSAAPRRKPKSPIAIAFDQVRISEIEIDGPDSIGLRGGSVTASGSLDRYEMEVTGLVDAPRLRGVRVEAAGIGNLERLTVTRSALAALDGTTRISGTVGWWPEIAWDMVAAVERIRPALLLPDTAGLPGTVSLRGSIRGAITSTGPSGTILVDSLGGVLRGQPLRGSAAARVVGRSIMVDRLDAGWGSVTMVADGLVADTLAVDFQLTAADLRTIAPSTAGAIESEGRISGPRMTPRVVAQLSGSRVAASAVDLRRLTGRIDVDLSEGGDNRIVLRADTGAISGRPVSEASLELTGPQARHRLSLVAVGPGDTLRLAVAGGLVDRRWQGTIAAVQLRNPRLGGWSLERPARLTASAERASLESLCLAADTAGGRVCAEGRWATGNVWNVTATVEQVPVVRLAPAAFGRLPGGEAAFSGGLGARLEARSDGQRIDATVRASSDTVAFSFREGTDSIVRRIALDSAVVAVQADRQGLDATIGLRVIDDDGREVALLRGTGSIPDYRPGQPLTGKALTARLEGSVDDLGFARPLLISVDSLTGAIRLEANVTGTVTAPRIEATAGLDSITVGFRDGARIVGAVAVNASAVVGRDSALSGEIRIAPRGVAFHYRRLGEPRLVAVDSAAATITAGTDGIRGNLMVRARQGSEGPTATFSAAATLPGYRRLGEPLGPQPITLESRAEIPDLAVMEPFLTAVDSLAGRVGFELGVTGKVAEPRATGALAVEDLEARLPSGTLVRGGVDGELELAVAADSTITGSVRLAPVGMTLRYLEGDAGAIARLDSTAVTATIGAEGVRGDLVLAIADSAGAEVARFGGQLRMPGWHRLGQPLRPQPIEAALEGGARDLGFIEAFTPQVDTAAGRLSVNARLTGTVADSRLVGGAELREVAMGFPQLGILIEKLDLDAKGDQEGSIDIEATLSSGGGTLTLSGTTPAQPTVAAPGKLRIEGADFEALNNEEIHAFISPRLDVVLIEDSISVKGEVDVPLAAVVLDRLPAFAIPPSEDIVLIDTLLAPAPVRPITAQVRITLGDSVSFVGFNFAAELGGSITVRQAPEALATATGTITIEQGRYQAYGQDLTIQDGIARFAGGPVDNPGLSLRASRTAEDSTVAGFMIGGTLKDPEVSLFSDREISQGQMLSYIVTGRRIGESGNLPSGNLLSRALNKLGLKGGSALAGAIGEDIGLDEARLETEGDIEDVALVAGRYLSPNLYVSYGIGLFDPVSTLRLRYILSNRFTLQAETGKETKADVVIKVETGR